MLKEILIILTLIASIPLGYLIAYMARDELIDGIKWFKTLMVLSFISFFVFMTLKEYVISCTLIFIFVVAYISLVKSRDKRWTKKKI